MTTWLYGLILPRNAERVPRELPGIGDAAVRLLPCGAVTAVVSTMDEPVSRSQVAAIRAHDRVLRAIAAQSVTVAAVRFGQSFVSDGDACVELSARHSEAKALEELDGCVEMRLLLPHDPAPVTEPPSEEPGPGRAYLERVRRQQLVPGVSLRPALGPLVQQELVERLEMDGGAGVVFAHLISAGNVERYRDAIADLPALAEARVLGPLPLYSFVGSGNG